MMCKGATVAYIKGALPSFGWMKAGKLQKASVM
jgi:hypothetical protein